MNIEQSLPILKKQLILNRTPFGRPLSEKALLSIQNVLEDSKNYNNESVQCQSCGLVISILLTQNGCVNCGVEKFNTDIKE